MTWPPLGKSLQQCSQTEQDYVRRFFYSRGVSYTLCRMKMLVFSFSSGVHENASKVGKVFTTQNYSSKFANASSLPLSPIFNPLGENTHCHTTKGRANSQANETASSYHMTLYFWLNSIYKATDPFLTVDAMCNIEKGWVRNFKCFNQWCKISTLLTI